jgi:hypothetical protein
MEKKGILIIVFILFLLISPFVAQSSALRSNLIRKQSISSSSESMFPFWFLCYVNTSGYGKAVHSGNSMFIAIEYSEEDSNVNSTIRSFLHTNTITWTHKIQVFFFVGETDLPLSGMEGNCSLSGMALMAYVW